MNRREFALSVVAAALAIGQADAERIGLALSLAVAVIAFPIGFAVPLIAADLAAGNELQGMLSDLTLIEDDMFFRIDPAGNEGGGHLARVLRQLLGAAPDRQRLGNRVQVDDAVDALVPVLQRDELGDGAEVIPEMQIACRLYAGKYSFLEAHARTSPMAPPDGTSYGAGASPFVYRREMSAGAVWLIAARPAAHHCVEPLDRYIARVFRREIADGLDAIRRSRYRQCDCRRDRAHR